MPSLLCSLDVTVLCCPWTGVCQPLPTVGASQNQSCTQQETDRGMNGVCEQTEDAGPTQDGGSGLTGELTLELGF